MTGTWWHTSDRDVVALVQSVYSPLVLHLRDQTRESALDRPSVK